MDFDLKFYLSLFMRRLPLFLLVWIVVAAIGVAVAFVLPAQYRSTASILVESEQIKGSTVNVSANEQIQIVQQRMMTRENLLDIAEQFDVYRNYPDLSPTDVVENMSDDTEFKQLQLGGRRPTRGTVNATAFTISFTARSGPMAARVANQLVTQILELNADTRIDTADSQVRFYEQEETRLNNELTTLENRISNFKTKNQSSLPTLLSFNQEQLLALRSNLTKIEDEERTINEQRDQMVRAIENPELIPTETTQATPQERQLAGLQTERDTLRLTYSATHPKVRAIDAKIKALEASMGPSADGEGILDLRVSRMELALEQLDGRFLVLRKQHDKLLEDIAELETAISSTPRTEAGLNVMERQYESLKSQYSANAANLANAKTGQAIETGGKGERFSVIEQASVPDVPESPDRPLIAIGGIAGGLGMAFGLVVLLELLNKSIRRPADLVSGLGLQPFATIPYITTARETRRRQLGVVSTLAMIAIAIPAVLYAIHYYYLPLDLLIERLAGKLGIEALLAMLS